MKTKKLQLKTELNTVKQSNMSINDYTKVKKLQLKTELNTVKRGNMSINDYASKVKTITNSLGSIGVTIDENDIFDATLEGLGTENDIVASTLEGLGTIYKNFKSSMNTRANVLDFTEFTTMLICEEKSLGLVASSSQSNINYDQQAFYSNRGRGRGIGGGCNGQHQNVEVVAQVVGAAINIRIGSKIRVKVVEEEDRIIEAGTKVEIRMQAEIKLNASDVECWRCERGHYSNECPTTIICYAAYEQRLPVRFNLDGCYVEDYNNGCKWIIEGRWVGRMFTLNVSMPAVKAAMFAQSAGVVADVGIWHKCIGHVNDQCLQYVCYVQDYNNGCKWIIEGRHVGTMFTLDVSMPAVKAAMFAQSAGVVANVDIWHKRIGHVNEQRLCSMQSKQIVAGLSKFKVDGMHKVCEACQFGKQSRNSFPQEPNVCKRPFEVVHKDVWDPTKIANIHGSRYYVSFIDYHTRKVWVYFMKQKSKVFDHFKSFKSTVEKERGEQVKIPRSDGGGKYFSKEFPKSFLNFCRKMVYAGSPHVDTLHRKMELLSGRTTILQR
ncbi:hypothetical protein L7F22_047495 [Adiantum nelumboides]|nr:hypothetical protein [Adiantum nelumboides]